MKWSHVARARQVLAREEGAIVKDWGGKLPVALVYPNTYQVGMSSLGFQTVYRLFNARADVVCERATWHARYAADDPVLSIESQQPLAEFGAIAFSISYEMDYAHVVDVLRQAVCPSAPGTATRVGRSCSPVGLPCPPIRSPSPTSLMGS